MVEGTAREYKPGELVKIEVVVKSSFEFPNGPGTEGVRIPRLIAQVAGPSQTPQETCKVRLEDMKPGKVGVLLRKGTLTIQTIDRP